MLKCLGSTAATNTDDGEIQKVYVDVAPDKDLLALRFEVSCYTVGYISVFAPNVFFGTEEQAKNNVLDAALDYILDNGLAKWVECNLGEKLVWEGEL